MADRTQDNRQIGVQTALGGDELLFSRMRWTESLGRPFEGSIELRSEKLDVDATKLLGTKMTVSLGLPDGGTRYFNGYVSRFLLNSIEGETAVYHATLVPWLWFLTRASDCTIFQESESAEIVDRVFERHGFVSEQSLTGSYVKRDFCVQYRESDFDFVSRLMEQDGLYYFFNHSDGDHSLKLVDSPDGHEPFSGYERLPFREPHANALSEGEQVWDWTLNYEVQSGSYSLNDFDFVNPSADIQVRSLEQRSHEISEMPYYDYPGDYVDISHGEQLAANRLQEMQARHEVVSGTSNARGLAVGSTFELEEYPREDQNRSYLLTSANYLLESDAYGANAGGGGGSTFSCNFEAIPADRQYRPERVTPRPVVKGPQTAIVVGPEGEEITTDDDGHGRVKVHFHWDRRTDCDWTQRSCWIRVAQLSAGKGWGGISIPRRDQEVVVEFLEGDPDKPIITGRVYNAEQPPPYALPANNTQSGIKTRSSKSGGAENFNEIRMEDKKGSEHFYIQAEKDKQILVKNDRSKTVGNDESMEVGNDRTRSVGHDEAVSVGNDRKVSVGANESIGIGANQEVTVGANETRSVAANRTRNVGSNETVTVASLRTHTVGVNDMLNVGAAQEVTVGGAQAVTVGGARSVNVAGAQQTSVGVTDSKDVGGDSSLDVGKDRTETVKGDWKHRSGKKIVIEAGDEITIKTGKASITMKKNGDIAIQGKKISVKGSGDIVMKGKKILEN